MKSVRTISRKMLADAAQEKTRSNARSVATDVSMQISSGTSQKMWRNRLQWPNNAPRLQCREIQQLGNLQRGISEKKVSSVNGPLERLQETHDKVTMEDISRLSIAEENVRKSTDFLRRIVAPVCGMGGVTLSFVCPHCNCFPLDDYTWCRLDMATQQGYWWCNSVPMPTKRKSSKRMQPRWGCVITWSMR